MPPLCDNFVSGKIILLIMKMFAAHATPFEAWLTIGHRTDEPSPPPLGHCTSTYESGCRDDGTLHSRASCAAMGANLELMVNPTVSF